MATDGLHDCLPHQVPERFAEASRSIRHCALSLVGEPIIYPRINDFLDLLHAKGISSFMVTHAHPPLAPTPACMCSPRRAPALPHR